MRAIMNPEKYQGHGSYIKFIEFIFMQSKENSFFFLVTYVTVRYINTKNEVRQTIIALIIIVDIMRNKIFSVLLLMSK